MSGSDMIRGSSPRLITVPGYHIHPQYDLAHTRALLHERRSKKKIFTLSLAPMVDMFSILVIYLLMNFSTSGEAFFVGKDIVIPKATRGTAMKSFPLLSIVGGKVMFESENMMGAAGLTGEELAGEDLPMLRETLRRLKEISSRIDSSDEARNQVNIQADENTPLEEVKKVMRVLVDEGWTGMNFIVDPSK